MQNIAYFEQYFADRRATTTSLPPLVFDLQFSTITTLFVTRQSTRPSQQNLAKRLLNRWFAFAGRRV